MFSGLDAIDVPHGRRWTALASFVLQGILVGAALVLPLLHPAILPEALAGHRIFIPMPLGEPHIQPSQNIQPHGGTGRLTPIPVRNDVFTYRPAQNTATAIDQPPGLTDLSARGPGRDIGIEGVLSTDVAQPVLRPTIAPKPRPISVVMEGNLVHRVDPLYPAIAKQIRLQGTVVVQAFVSADGRIERPTAVSGPAILARAALDAVRRWQYRPYYLNGQPVEVETLITVKFILNQ